MNRKIAVITGASSGMGRRFAETVKKLGKDLDEVWLIARRQERLREVNCGFPTRILALDLTDGDALLRYGELLRAEEPEICLLVNAGGYGKFESSIETPLGDNLNMVDLNCKALLSMCQQSIPYMKSGDKIINFASVAAFQPIPYINVYGATKAFVLSYSRALGRELRSKGISVTAVCPFWTKTEFFDRAVDTDREPVVKKYVAMYDPEKIVDRAWRDALRGRDLSMYGFKAISQTVLTKLLPHKFVMDFWQSQQGLK